jgi:translation elongation factor EF-1beta
LFRDGNYACLKKIFFLKNKDEHEKEIMRRAAENEAKKKAAGKAPVIQKSAVVIDVKPWDDETDMKLMEEKVRAIQMEGLEWKASKLQPIGYGIKKLQISCHIVDDLVSVDDIQEKIQEFEDLVQSTDINSFEKL